MVIIELYAVFETFCVLVVRKRLPRRYMKRAWCPYIKRHPSDILNHFLDADGPVRCGDGLAVDWD